MEQSLKPELLDIVRRESDWAVFHDGQALKTPAGADIACRDFRVAEHVLRELTLGRALDLVRADFFGCFVLHHDLLERGRDPLRELAGRMLLEDKALSRLCGDNSRRDAVEAERFMDFMEKHGEIQALMFGSATAMARSFNDLLMAAGVGPAEISGETPELLRKTVCDLYASLPTENRAIVTLLCAAHSCGLLPALLLASRRFTPSEYAACAMAANVPEPRVSESCEALAAAVALAAPVAGFRYDWENSLAVFERLRSEAARCLEYPACLSDAGLGIESVKTLISKGESFSLEFKSSLRFNVKAGRNDPAIEHAALKTMCAFLNSSGGTLLIGVENSGEITGIEKDAFADDDRFSLHFWNLVKSGMGQDLGAFIHAEPEKVDGKTVFRVQCDRSPRAVFLKLKGPDEEFYIRVGPSSVSLGIREAMRYMARRFEKSAEPV